MNKYYKTLKEDMQTNISLRALMLGIMLGLSIGYLTSGLILRGLYCFVIVMLLWFVTIPDYSRLVEYRKLREAVKSESNEQQPKNSVVLLQAGVSGCLVAITKQFSVWYKSAKEQFRYYMNSRKNY
jgi:hypothetical protein